MTVESNDRHKTPRLETFKESCGDRRKETHMYKYSMRNSSMRNSSSQ